MGPQLFIGSLDVTKSWEYADSTWGVPTAWTQSRKQGFRKEESLAVKGWHLNYAWKRVRKRPSVGGKGLKIPIAKAGRLQAAWASAQRQQEEAQQLWAGSLAKFFYSKWETLPERSEALECNDAARYQRKWAWPAVWVCLEEEEGKAHLHGESVMKTVHAPRPENIVVMCTQLSSVLATSCWSEK